MSKALKMKIRIDEMAIEEECRRADERSRAENDDYSASGWLDEMSGRYVDNETYGDGSDFRRAL